MNSDHCADCQRPIRTVRVWGWSNVKEGTGKIALDYVKSPSGAYAVIGPDTAKFIEEADRPGFSGPLYTDHRRTCLKVKAKDAPKVTMELACDSCGAPLFLTLTFGDPVRPKCEACSDGLLMFVGILSEAS